MRINKAGYIFSLIFGLVWSMAFVSSVVWSETDSQIGPFAEKIFTDWKTGAPMPQISAGNYPSRAVQGAAGSVSGATCLCETDYGNRYHRRVQGGGRR